MFDELLPLRQRIAERAGFANYRDYQFRNLKRFDYTPGDCDAFAHAVEKHVVPLMHELDHERKAALKVEKLRPWDLSVDAKGRPPLRPFADDDIPAFVETTRKVFERMDPKLADDFDQLRQAGNLDLDSRRGKQPGGYQCNLEESGVPFIFMNAAGLQRDVETLLHEGGHAFHTLAAADEPLTFLRHAPMEFCEVASMSMELLALPHLGLYFDDDEKADRARRHQLEGVGILGWIAVIDQFQQWLYTHPGHSRDDRTATWNGLLGRFYHDLDWTGIDESRDAMWQRQLHLFHVPFYYIEYGIAQLGRAADLQQQQEGHGQGAGGLPPRPELRRHPPAAGAVRGRQHQVRFRRQDDRAARQVDPRGPRGAARLMPRTRIKICGVTSVEDALAAAAAGADAVGMILYAPKATRMIDANLAREIAMKLPPFVSAVGVVQDCPHNRVRQLMAHIPLDAVQLHGKEPRQEVRGVQPTAAIKKLSAKPDLAETALKWATAIIPNLAGLLIEHPGPGGTGEETDWSVIEQLDRATLPPILVAGGLTPANVADVIRRTRPWGVDVSSGVESEHGKKSPERMAEFVEAVRAADL